MKPFDLYEYWSAIWFYYIHCECCAFAVCIYIYMVDSHESDAFGPYFEKVHFFNIQNEQRLYITHSEAPHQHLINSQHFFCFCKFEFF